MRVLFVTWAWRTHLYPMVPLARALLARGHEVRVASQPGLVAEIDRLGLPAAPVGRDRDVRPVFRRFAVAPGAPPPAPPPPGRVPRAVTLFVELAEAMVDDLVAVGRGWRPDLVIHEPTALAGPLAAAALGVPAVRHLYGPDLMRRAARFLPDLLAPLTTRLGLADVDVVDGPTLDPTPDLLRLADHPDVRAVRHLPYPGGPAAVAPAPAVGATGRRRICVTWGWTMAGLDPRLFLAGEAGRAAAGLADEVVLVVSAAQVPLLGDLPAHVRVLVDVPLAAALPGADLLISQGGAGSVLTGLVAGVPQVAVGQLPDHLAIARQLAAAGAGAALGGSEATRAAIAAAASAVLADPGPARVATAVAAANAIRPRPEELVDGLVALAGR